MMPIANYTVSVRLAENRTSLSWQPTVE